MSRFFYSLLLWLLSPVYLLKFYWRSRSEPLYRHALFERWGWYGTRAASGLPTPVRVWVHAVSLGETHAAGALLKALRLQRPSLQLLLTHSTATGRQAGQALLQPGDLQVWLPLDTPGAVQRFFQHFQPQLGVLMETEIWPNLLHASAQAKVPMVLANARLSAKSLRRGQLFSKLLCPAVKTLALVLAQTQADAQRLQQAGAQRIEVCGNLKFDIAVNASLIAQGRRWRLNSDRVVLLAASTREGEEALLLKAWVAYQAAWGAQVRLLIVPRHPQRFQAVATLIEASGLSLARRSQWGDEPSAQALNAQVWLGDSMGEMPLYYALARAALLGGSFAPFGGQNLIEAAACGCPVIMGPHTFNFAQAAQLSAAAGAAIQVQNMSQALELALQWLHCEQAPAAEKALLFFNNHQGAAQHSVKFLMPYLE
jgi:3-deoxy-D-manno-octulosonic-acid transferase